MARELSDDMAKLIVKSLDRTFADRSNDVCEFSEEESKKLGLTKNSLEIAMMTTLFNKCCGIGMPRNPLQRPGLANRHNSMCVSEAKNSKKDSHTSNSDSENRDSDEYIKSD